MSEFINNASRRKELLKEALRKLHDGQTVEALQQEYGDIIRTSTSAEIAETERALIAEGMPVSEVQRLCDLHVAVFKEGLEQELAPEIKSGHPLHDLQHENELFMRLMEALGDLLVRYQVSGAPQALETLQAQIPNLQRIERHYSLKENLIFPYMEKYGFEGPSKVMWGVHNEIRALLKQFYALLMDGQDGAGMMMVYDSLTTKVQEMIYKEEKILFPEAMKRLTEADWQAIKQQESSVTMTYQPPKPEKQASPASAAVEPPTRPVSAVEGLLPLNTGALTLHQMDLMLRNLPVDVTFVDENDEVRYFSQSKERIFTRTAAIIGRKVQNCHPPQSVAQVQRILDDFRAGRRDQAEFWIRMGGKFILIRYYALRDDAGKFCGTLEVSQDATSIRALQGERRLLDD